jgi:hypothetical protein
MSSKPLLVGEANPWQSDYESAMHFALHPDPPQASGGRLCYYVMGLDERTYLRSFDRIDLCHPKWSMRAARVKAAQLTAERTRADVIVLCGAKVAAAAFGVKSDPFVLIEDFVRPRLVVLPHPSGLCRRWSEPGTVERARDVLRRAGVLPTEN